MILDKEINIKVNARNVSKVRDFKNNPNIKIGNLITIPISFLTKGSHTKIRCKCEVCGKEKKIAYQKYNKNINNGGYYSCSSKCSQNKVKKTNQDKFGKDYYSQTTEYEKRTIETNLRKYNSEYYLSSEIGKENINKSLNKKYGVNNPFQLDSVKEKIKKTNLERYGFENPSHSKEIKDILRVKSTDYWNKSMKNYYKENHNLNILSHQGSEYLLQCRKCGKNFKIDKGLLANRLQLKMDICTKCNPRNNPHSNYEKQLVDFIKEIYNGEIILNTRNIIDPLELDIYLPKENIAIEFNGLYWHSDLFKPKNYHYNKHQKCKDNGIELLQIWEDDWLYKKEIVKSIIKNKLGLNKTNRIYARKCEVRNVNKDIANEFLKNNHLKGNCRSKIYIGLYDKEKLVSIMSFGRTRSFMNGNKKETNKYELHRFCNRTNYSIIGGASKILNKFKKDVEFDELISYYDKSFGYNSFYESVGFSFDSETPINYYYIKSGIRKHRYNYNKAKLVKLGYDKNKTEKEITQEMGINRIYGPGNYKYILLNNQQQ